ncbi:MAG: hypothetical protein OXE99_06330, partial [Cellvibrionales bacterium]|nr:hypothetical protein [Cellvibrionales bacterium]
MNNKFMKVVGLASVMTALVNCGSDGDSSGGGESIKSKFPPLTSSNTIEGTWILQSTGSYTYDYKNIGDNYAYTDYREGDFSTKSMIIIKQENETQISITSCEIIESFAFTDMLPEQPSSNEENSELP